MVNKDRQLIKNKRFQDELDTLFNKEIKLMSDYIIADKPVRLKHIKCGNEFSLSRRYVIKKESAGILCGCVKGFSRELTDLKNKKFDKKLAKEYQSEYKRLSDFKGINEDIVLLHRKCNRKIVDSPSNFFKRKHKCPHCYKVSSKKIKRAVPKNEFYQDKIDNLTNKEYELMSDYYNLGSHIKLKHRVCGHVFPVRPDSFENAKEKCPSCAGRLDKKPQTLSEMISTIENQLDNEYELLTKLFTLDDFVSLRHKKCGTIIERTGNTIKQYNKNGNPNLKCPTCEEENKKEDFLDKLNKLYGDDYGIRGYFKYQGLEKEVSLHHKKCGKNFKVKPINMLNHPQKYSKYCSGCEQDYKRNEYNEKIVNYYGDSYELYGEYEDSYKKVDIIHKECGTIIKKRKNNLFDSKNLCPVCRVKNRIKAQLEKIDLAMKNLYNNEVIFTGEYKSMRDKSKFYCTKCESDFYKTPEKMVQKRIKCPNCNS